MQKNNQKMSLKIQPIFKLATNGATPKENAKMLNKPLTTVYPEFMFPSYWSCKEKAW